MELAVDLVRLAAYHYENSNYTQALNNFLILFKLDPKYSTLHKDAFAYTLRQWGRQIGAKKSFSDLQECYYEAFKYYPMDVDIIKDYIIHLIQKDLTENDTYFEDFSVVFRAKGLPYEKSLQSAILEMVSRWHFRMVNDYERNLAYCKAIFAYGTGHPVKVLDIGAGAGLLSLFASNNPDIEEIYAIESEEALVEVARAVFADNEMKRVRLIGKCSDELTEDDINGRADLVVTEIFDAALFGEHVLETLSHAWENLLTKDAKIIPQSADLFITGIESDFLEKKHRVVRKLELLKSAVIVSDTGNPYEAENLKFFEWKPITEQIKIITVNFCSLNQLKTLLLGEEIQFTLKCVTEGKIDAFTIFFDLHLDENVLITTDPKADSAKCWEHAIFYVDFPKNYKIGDEIELIFSCPNNRATLNFANPIEPPENHFPVSSETISYLNDDLIVKTMEKLASTNSDSSLKRVLDFSRFPLFGLFSANDGKDSNILFHDDATSALIQYIMTSNNIHSDRVNTIPFTNVEYVDINVLNYDIILCDVIKLNGTLNNGMFCFLRDYYTRIPGRLMLPNAIKLVFEVVESEYLPYCSRANNDSTFSFKIADRLNKFAIDEQWMVDKGFAHKKLTDRVDIDVLRDDSELLIDEFLIPVKCRGNTDGVLYWFELYYGNDLKISTLESTHYNIACFMLHRNDVVYESNDIKLFLKQHNGHLKIFF